MLHYAQEVFEGLKAYRWTDGSIVSFRPDANAARLRSSARRLAIPELPDEVFVESLRQLDRRRQRLGARAPAGKTALYLRPFIFATEPGLGVRPANEYRYLLIASPAGAYFKGGINPVNVWVSTEYVRASPGGTGAAKFGGNYAASLLAQAQAAENGCDQVVWLDAVERRYVEEMGGMNLFFVLGSGGSARLVTPELSGSLLPGITRDSLLQLAIDARVRSRRAQDRYRRVAEESRSRRDHRGVRLRHRRRHHPGRTGEVRRAANSPSPTANLVK